MGELDGMPPQAQAQDIALNLKQPPKPPKPPLAARPSRQRALREMRRAEQQAARGEIAEAIKSLEQAVAFGADRYTCFLRMARLHQTRRQWSEAVVAAEKAIAEEPAKLTAREAVITLHLEARNYEKAIDASKALLKISPRHVPARDALGAAYMGLGDLDAALRVANDLIRLDPSNPSHRFTKAHLCEHQGEMSLAIEEFERVSDLVPHGDIGDAARRHLENLDSFQLNQIMALAYEDMIFRLNLMQDSDAAIHDKGFCLSELGREALHDLASDGFPDLDAPTTLSQYH